MTRMLRFVLAFLLGSLALVASLSSVGNALATSAAPTGLLSTAPFPSLFPVAVWLQDPADTTGFKSGYPTLGAAATAEGINTFLGFYDWPSAFGVDNSSGGQGAQFQAACNAGLHVIAGGDPSSNTSAESVASVEKIASDETQAGTGKPCTDFLAGYNWDDEPAECSANVATQVAAIHADDPTRPTLDNMAGWVTWGDSGCDSTANAAFAAPSYPSSDDYHNTDPWNADNCKAAAHVSSSPWADCSWLYGYQGAMQTSLAGGKPTWEFIETGTDELGFSSQNGSSCNTTTNTCSNGNEYNATAPQVNADAWAAILNGVDGIEWFCHGTAQGQNLSDSDCMGGNGSASNAIFSNLKYIDGSIQSYAPELLSSTQGSCTMQPSSSSNIDTALLTSCSGGDLSMNSSSSTEPIMGMTKIVNGTTYLFVEADRANGTTTGTYTVSGVAGQTAKLVYDSAAHYDPAASEQGDTFTLNGSGSFSDSLTGDTGAGSNAYGAGANGYQVKIYAIGSTTSGSTTTASSTAPSTSGYWLVASDGGTFAFGDAGFFGTMGGQRLNAPIVGMVRDPHDGGYIEVASDGGLFSFAPPGVTPDFFGSMGGGRLNAPIVGMVWDPHDGGYIEVASDGGLFSFAPPGVTPDFFGSMGGRRLNAPIVGMVWDAHDGGYIEVASDGGLFSFAPPGVTPDFFGSMGGGRLNAPIVGMVWDPYDGGYIEVASDGGLFSFAPPGVTPDFFGSMGGGRLNAPIVGMVWDPYDGGYIEVASDGGLFSFAPPGVTPDFFGSMGGQRLNAPIVGMV